MRKGSARISGFSTQSKRDGKRLWSYSGGSKEISGDILEITRGKKNKKLLITTIIDRCELLKCSGCRNVAGDFCNLFNKISG